MGFVKAQERKNDFETCIIGFGMKNRFRNISNFLDLDYFEKIKISINYDY